MQYYTLPLMTIVENATQPKATAFVTHIVGFKACNVDSFFNSRSAFDGENAIDIDLYNRKRANHFGSKFSIGSREQHHLISNRIVLELASQVLMHAIGINNVLPTLTKQVVVCKHRNWQKHVVIAN